MRPLSLALGPRACASTPGSVSRGPAWAPWTGGTSCPISISCGGWGGVTLRTPDSAGGFWGGHAAPGKGWEVLPPRSILMTVFLLWVLGAARSPPSPPLFPGPGGGGGDTGMPGGPSCFSQPPPTRPGPLLWNSNVRKSGLGFSDGAKSNKQAPSLPSQAAGGACCHSLQGGGRGLHTAYVAPGPSPPRTCSGTNRMQKSDAEHQ